MKNSILFLLAAVMFLSLAGKARAQYLNFISTITDSVPNSRWVGGQGQNPRRAFLFSTWEPKVYGLYYDITSMRVKCATNWNNGDPFRIGNGKWLQGWIHENTIVDTPGRRILKFASRSIREGDIQNGFAIRSHGRSGGSPNKHLKANSEYWFVLDTDFNKNHNPIPTLRIAVSANSQGTSPGDSRWTVREGLEARANDIAGFDDVNGGWWKVQGASNYPLQFRIRGQRVKPNPLRMGEVIQVGNLDEPNFSGIGNWRELRKEGISAQSWLATRFDTITSPELPPHLFSVNHITMLNPIRSSVPSNTHFIRIFSNKLQDGWMSVPNRMIGEFSNGSPQVISGSFPGSHPIQDYREQHRFHVDESRPIYLKPDTRYWLVQGMVHNFQGSSPKILSFTRSFEQEGWPVSNSMVGTGNRGQRWWRKVYDQRHLERTMRFEFDVKIIPAKGDLNRDAKINILDLVAMNNEIRGWASLPGGTVPLANLDDSRDQGVDGNDRNLLIDIIMGR